jgi:SMC interacting uncharacterized protein involved in chromosome segregation
MPKTKLSRVEVRMTPEEKENLKRKATEAHMTVSKYIIHLSQTKRVILKDDIAKLTVEISRIGNNINQIAKVANETKNVTPYQLKLVQDEMKEVSKTVADINDKYVEITKYIARKTNGGGNLGNYEDY